MTTRTALQHAPLRLATLAAGLATALAVSGTVRSGVPAGAAPPEADHASGAVASRTAPGGPGVKSTWTEADKSGFGTARTRRSNVWFTLQDGRVSEVFYPDLSTPSVRSLELVVTDGSRFTDRETRMRLRTSRPDPSSLRFRQVGGRAGRYRLVKEVVTDPRRDTLALRVRLTSLDGRRYRVYAVYDPALGNDGTDDRGRTAGHTLLATDGSVATALEARPGLTRLTNAYAGRAGAPIRQLRRSRDLTQRYRSAGPGNVVQAARISRLDGRRGHRTATIALGFGGSTRTARAAATRSLHAGYTRAARRYDRGWHGYLSSLRPVPASAASVARQYRASALVIAAAEDKRNPGAIVASPSAPWVWGDKKPDLSSPSGAYHLVWARDSYQFGTALWADGDQAAARRVVDWLFGHQQKADGSFPQNSDVDGTPVWGSLQLDEVALPIVLAHLVGRTGPSTWPGVRRAAEFLVGFHDPDTGLAAPFSPQERWENQSGYSPNSIAAQIAGLVAAADIATRNGHPELAQSWLATADTWAANVKGWTVTTNGPLSASPYFLRLTKNGQPNTPSPYQMGDGGPASVDQRLVVDPSFLALPLMGILPSFDPAIASSLDVVDQQLRFETPNGAFWHRFSYDGYGETTTGGEWTITDPGTFMTFWRGWPILAAERGEYEVAAGRSGASYLASVAAAANPSDMISEQVWDGRPPTGRPCCEPGEGTRAATPLVWSHAALIRLAWTIQQGRPVDQQDIVTGRYLP
ncbi:glucoamylase [Nocardioides terrae]|uniref:Glucoamylase n=1 Tax=Nocardioides terrae TaxID=574651 RepID=A0A1I1LA18_9ACTN|nr:glycoside hydrolase family 15 protein [Nocardioides terrae]SFC67878.1 glucoamylase [Nocardioides terrae]